MSFICEILQTQDQLHLVYPTDLKMQDVVVRHGPTPVDTLVDVLCMAHRSEECKLVQVLSKLESLQMQMARCRMLNIEEDRLVDVDEAALLKTDATSARLAPTLAELSDKTREFVLFLSNVPAATINSEAFAPYKFSNVAEQLDQFYQSELKKATDRWCGVFSGVCDSLNDVIPPDWKEKALDSEDRTFINNKILVQSLIGGLGSDYLSATSWLSSLEVIPAIYKAVQEAWGDSLVHYKTTLYDTRNLAAVILGYNCIISKFPKASAADRRQFAKDLKKRLKTKFGKDYEMPQAMADRIAAAISAK